MMTVWVYNENESMAFIYMRNDSSMVVCVHDYTGRLNPEKTALERVERLSFIYKYPTVSLAGEKKSTVDCNSDIVR